MHREHGLQDFAAKLKLSSKIKSSPKEVYFVDCLDFLDWLKFKPHSSRWEAPVALQGLAGLAVEEVLRLTWDKIDLERGMIEISGKVKNSDDRSDKPVIGFKKHIIITTNEHQWTPIEKSNY